MIELAVALSAIAARAIVVELVRGGTFDRNSWADVAGQVVETMVATSARCAGVEVRADLRQYWSSREAGAVTVDVRNTRAEWIAAELVRESGTLASRTAVIVTLPTDNTLPAENRVAPGDTVALDLTPTVLPSPWVRRSRWLAAATGESTFTLSVPTPPVATIGFLLPENRTTEQTNQKSSTSSSR